MSKVAELGEKEFENFKKAERLFGKKQYKQAIKHCDLVLKKVDSHGETLALKGAILGRLAQTEEEKQEAIDICKRGVGLSISNKAGWIHLARLYRQFWRYEESIKSYKNAINLKVVQWVTAQDKREWKRDMTFMLAQTRQWEELADIRRQLQLEPGDPNVQFVGYCMAQYFAGNYDTALTSFREFRKSLPTQANAIPDLDLLEGRMIEASGDRSAALAFYSQMIEKNAPNLLTQQENKARLALELGNFVQAQEDYLHLLRDRNQENYDYHRGLQFAVACKSEGFTKSGLGLLVNAESPLDIVQKVSELYNTLLAEFPKSFALERIPLDFCPEQEFQSRASKFIHRLWKKRVSSLFTMLKPLLQSRSELAKQSFQAIVDARLKELTKEEDKEERGQVLCFLAQLLDKCERGSAAALKAIDEALATEDKNPDFLRFKARILKHTGNVTAAFEAIDLARQQELSDRYLNNKAAKYAFRKDQPDLALALTHLFTRGEDVNSIPDAAILHDLQCMWFELEAAESAFRTGNVILAMKNFFWVQEHIDQIREDEFDFHEYCLRKLSLTSYADLIHMEDKVYSTAAFCKSAKGSLKCWLQVFDKNAGLDLLKKHEKEQAQLKKAEAASTDESQFAGMTPNEKKMAMKRLKAEKAEKERLEAVRKLEEAQKLVAAAAAGATAADEEEDGAAPAAAAEEGNKDMSSMNQKPTTKRRGDMPVDPDPLGFQRFARYCKDPLKPAHELLDLAFKTPANRTNVDLLLLAFDVNVRTSGKLDQAWDHLKTAAELVSWKHAGVVQRLVPFAHHVMVKKTNTAPACWSKGGVVAAKPAATFVLANASEAEAQISTALDGLQPSAFALKLMQDSQDLDVQLAAAGALLDIGSEVEAASAKLSSVVAPVEAAHAAQVVLAKFNKTAAATHKEAVKKVWPSARAFA